VARRAWAVGLREGTLNTLDLDEDRAMDVVKFTQLHLPHGLRRLLRDYGDHTTGCTVSST
jgi:hypothetical protein